MSTAVHNHMEPKFNVYLRLSGFPESLKLFIFSFIKDHFNCFDPNLLGDRNGWIEIVYGEEKIFRNGPTRSAKAGQKSLLPERQT